MLIVENIEYIKRDKLKKKKTNKYFISFTKEMQ